MPCALILRAIIRFDIYYNEGRVPIGHASLLLMTSTAREEKVTGGRATTIIENCCDAVTNNQLAGVLHEIHSKVMRYFCVLAAVI